MTTELPTNPRALLYRKIAAVTAAMERIPKNGYNNFHKYAYATESDLVDGIRALLAENGLAFLPPTVLDHERVSTDSKSGPLTRVKMRFALGCTDTGEVVESILWADGQDAGDKGFYKAYTGGVKYFLMKTFLISTGDDPEQRDAAPAPTRTQAAPLPPRPNANPATGEVLPKPAQPTNGSDKAKYITAVEAYLDCALAIGIEVDAIPENPTALSIEELTKAGRNLRAGIVAHIQQLNDQAVETMTGDDQLPDDIGYVPADLPVMKPAELKALGLRQIAYIEAHAQPELAL